MKNKLSSLDIKFCVGELKEILGSWTGKIYEIDGTFLFKFEPPAEKRKDLIIEPGRRIHLTSMKHSTPKKPSSFAMLLRKHLTNSKLTEIKQPDMERIVQLKFERKAEGKILIAELFGSGNLILCDENREVIKPYREETWKNRELRPGLEYTFPPNKGKNISMVNKQNLKKVLSGEKDLVRGLARNLSIGGTIAEEICYKAEISKETDPEKLSESDYQSLLSGIKDLISSEPSPRIIHEDGKPTSVLPFSFGTQSGLDVETFKNFNQALDSYFQKTSERLVENKQERKLREKIDSVKSRKKKQEKRLQELKNKVKETKAKADTISKHYKRIDFALENLENIRKSKNWNEVEEEVQEAATSGKDWAGIIESIRPEDGIVTFNLPEVSVELDLRRSSFENASEFYEEYKTAKKKRKGVKQSIKETEEELERLREEGIEGIEVPTTPPPERTREKMWFERYRWFRSSDGHLIIAGRDAKTNQEIVEKHMEPQDLYLHADLKGAPHTVIKGENEKISESIIQEAAKFAAIHSRAWRRGQAAAKVYWVRPEQVTKEAPSGEYIPKGSYMIEGERNYQTVSLEAGIGLLDEDDAKIPICGPISAIRAHSNFLIKIKPGQTKKSELAKKIKLRLEGKVDENIDIDELMQILPPGKGTLID
ncbi:hypothetical protein AKJ57_04220 [candidate division MSBL1 archaeon SCGC-AAA259A05]|uniref:NFACT RNA-binding domain-containing protein n=1 Tax=candidate division MSBL1 archaeon SCGC-AAA259A05 TaxID=1698259 RepID=A0A133U816_9EURY|nr:hypothetical protein AKJ57_04220 [candidate division MSBL1 archaeon SCGC-AAA259A05]